MPALLPVVKKESSRFFSGNKTICGGGVVLDEAPATEARGDADGDSGDVFAMAAAGLYYYYCAVMTLR